ncbi:MAG: hypothetical protein IJ220_01480 [Clostridia bacterium]|nr:hypothetical protein [Clostridia bacterium]
MKIKVEKKELILLVVIIIVVTIVGAVLYINSKKNSSNIREGEYTINHSSTEVMKNQAPLIDMNNTENVKIQNGEKVNSSEYLRKDKELFGLKITNIRLYTKNGLSNFNATVENTTEEDFEGRIVNLIFKKNDGSILTNVEAVIPSIKAKGSTTINASTTEDITNALDVEIEFN